MGFKTSIPCIYDEQPILDVEINAPQLFSTQTATIQSGEQTISPLEIPWHLTYTRATSVWEIAQGEDVIVAVLDSGLNVSMGTVPAENVLDGRNFTPDYNGDPTNYNDNHLDANYRGLHGTGMATLIAGKPQNSGSKGTVGIAMKTKLIIGKVSSFDGTGDTDWLADGIRWATDWVGPNGEKVDIISMSITAEGYDDYLYNAVKYAHSAGITMLAAAGNSVGNNTTTTDEYFYPASFPEVISVGAHTDTDSYVFNFANNELIDMASPGQAVMTVSAAGGTNKDIAVYGAITGTSPATAITAGGLAIILSAFRNVELNITKQQLFDNLITHLRPTTASNVERHGRGLLDFAYGTLPVKPYEPPVYPNTTPPVLTLETVVYDSVTLSWDYTPDETDNVYYQLMRDGVLISESKWLQTFTDLSVTELTSYSYKVAVMNKNGLVTESNELIVNVPGRSIKILSQVSLNHMKAELKVKGNSQDEVIEANMEIAKSFLVDETFCTIEELDTKPMAVGVFKRLVADLFYERMTTAQVKENPTYVAMLNRLKKFVGV